VKQNLVIPFVCSLFFVAHPIHTEVVNSVKSLDDILCFLLILIGILFFLKSIENNNFKNIIVGGTCYFFALLSKETAISYLLILPLLLYVFTQANIKQIMTVSIVLIIITGGYFFIRYFALETITQVPDSSPYNNSLFAAKDFITREATAIYILLKYILLLIFPHPLSHDYSFNQIPLINFINPLAIAGTLIYLGLAIYAILNIRKKNIIAFAILFYLITLAPVSNIFKLIGATMAERFLYMPSLGFCIIVTLLLVKVTKTDMIKSKISNIGQFVTINYLLFVIVFSITGLYAVKTIARSQDWKNNSVLYGVDAAIATNSSRAHVHNAVVIFEDQYKVEKNEENKKVLLDKAIEEFKKGLDIFPDYFLTYQGLGEAYVEKKDYKNAIFYFEKLISNFNDGKAGAYHFLITCYEKTNQTDKQMAADDSLLKHDPNNTYAYINKGTVYGHKGDYPLAIKQFEKALSINPNEVACYKNIGIAYGFQKEFQKAVEYLNKAATLDPNDAQVPDFLGVTYMNMGDSLKAKEYFEKAKMLVAGKKQQP
jgi:tetratricopeptide (TPR) repeat protein